MGLVCGTPTRFMPAATAAAADARTAQATTITPALGAGVKKYTLHIHNKCIYNKTKMKEIHIKQKYET